MKSWANLFKVIFLIVGIIVLCFGANLYNLCDQQKAQIDNISKQQQLEAGANATKFKEQQEQIERIIKSLEGTVQQIKDQEDSIDQQKDALTAQKDALLQEVEKRQKMENESKSIQISLVDIKAEADAMKQDMKVWQKDYVSVLAELDKKMDDSQDAIKTLDNNLTALNIPELKENIKSLKVDIDKITHPADPGLTKS